MTAMCDDTAFSEGVPADQSLLGPFICGRLLCRGYVSTHMLLVFRNLVSFVASDQLEEPLGATALSRDLCQS